METVEGNLLHLAKKGEFNVIVHGCNCFHEMGAGIAKQIRKQFPKAYEADLETEFGDRNKLGIYSYAKIKNLIIINAYTQYRYGGRKPVNYAAIKKVFKLIARDFSYERIGIPKIGAGLAKGDWKKIKAIIEKETKGVDITVVILPK